MALPGTPGERISDLCNDYHITQKELAKRIGVSASQRAGLSAAKQKRLAAISSWALPMCSRYPQITY